MRAVRTTETANERSISSSGGAAECFSGAFWRDGVRAGPGSTQDRGLGGRSLSSHPLGWEEVVAALGPPPAVPPAVAAPTAATQVLCPWAQAWLSSLDGD